jgi:hypothetical protein
MGGSAEKSYRSHKSYRSYRSDRSWRPYKPLRSLRFVKVFEDFKANDRTIMGKQWLAVEYSLEITYQAIENFY